MVEHSKHPVIANRSNIRNVVSIGACGVAKEAIDQAQHLLADHDGHKEFKRSNL